MNRSKYRTALMIAWAVTGTGVTTAQPQAVQPLLEAPAQAAPALEMQRQLEIQVEQKRKAYFEHLNLRIDEMDRVCDLSESQKKKLRIAAKGAADRATAGFRKQLMQLHQQLAIPVPAAMGPPADIEVFAAPALGPPVLAPVEAPVEAREAEQPAPPARPNDVPPPAEEPPRAPVREAVPVEAPVGEAYVDPQVLAPVALAEDQNPAAVDIEADVMQFAFNGFVGGVNNNDSRAVIQQSIWVATVAKVLSDAQQKAVEEVAEQRTAFYRHSAVAQAISVLDFELLLTEVQRAALQVLIDQSIGRQLAAMKLQEIQFGFAQPQIIQQLLKRVPKAKLGEILSETQLDAWTKFIKRSGNGFFQIQAAAAGAPLLRAVPAEAVEAIR